MSTPYEIFRDAPTVPLDNDEGGASALQDVTLDQIAVGEASETENEKEDGDGESEEGEDKENVSPNPTFAPTVRPLSPNSRQIRANARRLLLQEPGERRRRNRRKARMSMPLMPNNGPLINANDSTRNVAKVGGNAKRNGGATAKSSKPNPSFKGRYTETVDNTNSRSKVGRSHEFHALTSLQSELADFDIKREMEADMDYIKQEIEADLAEIRDAAKSMVGSLTGAVSGVGAGAWGMVGYLWEGE
ncbi:hypothetical protein ACHAXT_002426 [Thalassiosira profunda]